MQCVTVQATVCPAGADCLLMREMEISVVGSRAARDVDLSLSSFVRRQNPRSRQGWADCVRKPPVDNNGVGNE